jgi:predicted metal-dependent hydrolase
MPVDAKAAMLGRTAIAGHSVEYRLRSVPDGGLRVRVGPRGIEVLHPPGRPPEDIETFLQNNGTWLLEQLERIKRLPRLHRDSQRPAGEILLYGFPTQVRVEDVPRRERSNQIRFREGELVVVLGRRSRTPPVKTLENWLRREARAQIAPLAQSLADGLGVSPGRLYIMDQQTKWGNCSALGNLSFNWRLVMAPNHVLRYLVTHEVVHLVVPDHSNKFWLTVQSLCPQAERARQWLSANGPGLLVPLEDVIGGAPVGRGIDRPID